MYASEESRPQNTLTIRWVACTTGSELSPPAGDTAPIGGQRAFTSVRACADDTTGALIELCQTGGQISRVTLFTRHFLQTTGHLTQSLCPTGGGVCHDSDRVAHIAVVFSDGDAGVDGSFTRSYRHIRGVCNQNGTVHQRFAGFWVLQFRELVEYVGHFVSAFAAADVNNDVNVRTILPAGAVQRSYRSRTDPVPQQYRLWRLGTGCR